MNCKLVSRNKEARQKPPEMFQEYTVKPVDKKFCGVKMLRLTWLNNNGLQVETIYTAVPSNALQEDSAGERT